MPHNVTIIIIPLWDSGVLDQCQNVHKENGNAPDSLLRDGASQGQKRMTVPEEGKPTQEKSNR